MVGEDKVDERESTSAVIGRLLLPIYFPSLLVQTGVGMLLTVLPLYLRDEVELSFTMVAIVIAAGGLGGMVSQIPAGVLLSRASERPVMVAALALVAVSTALVGTTGLAVTLIVLRLAWGVGSTGWLLSRQTLMTRAAPPYARGRAMSLFGGIQRVGVLTGAVLGGYLLDRTGSGPTFMVVAAITLAGVFPLIFDRNPVTSSAPIATDRPSLASAVGAHRHLLLLAGTGQITIIAVRTGRHVLLPLVGIGLGLNATEIGFLVGIGSFADLILFPLAGWIMDAYGRLFAIVPGFCLLGVGLLLLSVADGYAGVAVAATVIGLGNSIGAGTMLTMASDLAPAEGASQFLGALGTIREAGKIAGPLTVGWLADVAGLPTAAAVLGVLAFIATALIVFGIGETRDYQATQQAMA